MTVQVETENPEDTNIWSSILQQVQASHTKRLPSNKALLVLGDEETGKTTLIAKLAGNDSSITKGAGLEYNFIDIRDEYREESTKLGVWILDGDSTYVDLLSFALSDASFEHTTCMLVASMDQPWNIIRSIEKWANVLEQRIESLKLKDSKLKQLKQKLALKFIDYVSPADEVEAKLVNSKVAELPLNTSSASTTSPIATNATNELDATVNLTGDALKRNLGLPIIVVITKTDYMSNLEKDLDYNEETFDYIQQAIRRFCIEFGASLFYVSSKTNTNCELLHKYLAHCIYDLPFKTSASVIAKELIFVPAGWDNQSKIDILNENIQDGFDEEYSNVIIEPEKPHQVSAEAADFVVEEDSALFARIHQETLSQKPDLSGNIEQTSQTMLASQTSMSPSQQRQDSLPPGDSQNQSEGVLQNFFYSLLSNPQNAINRRD